MITDLAKGRDHELPDFPMAIGAARPCIEAWLLVDASALRHSLGLAQSPELPASPESLPAPTANRKHNPKTVLAAFGAATQARKDAIGTSSICTRLVPAVLSASSRLQPKSRCAFLPLFS